MKQYIKQTTAVVILLAACILFAWVLIFTPIPVYVLDRLNLRPLFLPDIKCDGCNNFTYNFLVANENFCNKPGADSDVFLLIMVASYHPNVDARKAIRKTWGGDKQHKGLNVKTLFIFGTHADKNLNKQVQYELDHYGDVMQANFTDKYRTLTNKSMIGLQWVLRYCPQAKFVLKTDDDAFNVPQRYMDYLINTHLETFIGGYCFTIMPDRSPSSKFYTPYSMYPNYHYPTYCAGPGYVLSISAVRKIVDISPNVLFLPMEDVYVSGMCRVAAGIQYVQIEGTVISKHDMTRCNVASWAKNSHNTLPQEAIQIWRDNVIPANKIKDCARGNVRLIFALVVFFLVWIKILYNVIRKR